MQFSYSTILHLRWYCSYMSKKIWPFPIWPSYCWDFLGLYAKCILHLAYARPAGDALTCTSFYYFYLLTPFFNGNTNLVQKLFLPKKKKKVQKQKVKITPSPVTFSHYNEGQTRPLNSIL